MSPRSFCCICRKLVFALLHRPFCCSGLMVHLQLLCLALCQGSVCYLNCANAGPEVLHTLGQMLMRTRLNTGSAALDAFLRHQGPQKSSQGASRRALKPSKAVLGHPGACQLRPGGPPGTLEESLKPPRRLQASPKECPRAPQGPQRTRQERPRQPQICLLYTSPSPRDVEESRMPSSA